MEGNLLIRNPFAVSLSGRHGISTVVDAVSLSISSFVSFHYPSVVSLDEAFPVPSTQGSPGR